MSQKHEVANALACDMSEPGLGQDDDDEEDDIQDDEPDFKIYEDTAMFDGPEPQPPSSTFTVFEDDHARSDGFEIYEDTVCIQPAAASKATSTAFQIYDDVDADDAQFTIEEAGQSSSHHCPQHTTQPTQQPPVLRPLDSTAHAVVAAADVHNLVAVDTPMPGEQTLLSVQQGSASGTVRLGQQIVKIDKVLSVGQTSSVYVGTTLQVTLEDGTVSDITRALKVKRGEVRLLKLGGRLLTGPTRFLSPSCGRSWSTATGCD